MFWEFVDPGRAEFAGIGNYEFLGNGVAFTILCCDPEAMDENRERLVALQTDATDGSLTEAELERAKRKTIASLLLQAERPESRMFSIGNQWRLHQRYRTTREVAAMYQAVTLADIERDMDRQRAELAKRPNDAPLDLGPSRCGRSRRCGDGPLPRHCDAERGRTGKVVRERCGDHCCTVLHRGADHATGAPANLLKQSCFIHRPGTGRPKWRNRRRVQRPSLSVDGSPDDRCRANMGTTVA